jgi:hypothetical protein
MVNEVSRLAASCGITISVNDLTFLNQLMFGYLSKRQDGQRALFKLLKLAGIKTQPATYMKTYYKEGYFGMDEHKINHGELEEIRAWLYQGERVLPYDAIEVNDRPDQTTCEDCLALVPAKYCADMAKEFSNGKETLLTLCNHCRLYRADPKIRDTASQKTCDNCQIKGCAYHPSKNQALRDAVEEKRLEQARSLGVPLNNFTQIEHKPLPPQERYSAL